MWVWSDDLVKRIEAGEADAGARIPLVAYAVAPETDLDEFAQQLMGGSRVSTDAVIGGMGADR